MAKLLDLNEDPTYTKHESVINQYWKDNDIYKKTDDMTRDNEHVIMCDGPPFVSSDSLHFGHLMISSIKSAVHYYNLMHGKHFLNKLGFDVHGVPSEGKANQLLGISSNKDIDKLGLDKYNKYCKEMVNSYSNAWRSKFEAIGRWTNYDNHYKTMDAKFMESVWWAFAQLFKKGLIYKSYKVMPYSTKCGTSLSNFEAGQSYKEIQTKSIYVLFKSTTQENTSFVAWTTTPWTLPSNMALCVNGLIEYVCVTDKKDNKYIVARDCVKNLKLDVKEINSLGDGKNLVGMEYEPLFPYLNRDNYKIISADFVEGGSSIGTGIVHLAAAHGEEDYNACIENKLIDPEDIGSVCLVDNDGNFVDTVTEFKGMYIFDANDEIIKNLKLRSLHFKTESYKHNYPFCYRTDTPLIYRAVPSYFIKVTALKDKLLSHNEKINWYPKNIGEGRFKNWLENVRDWNVSRSRYFGNPVPIWVSDDGEEIVCIESIDQLVEMAELKERPTDIHPEFIWHLTIPSKQGKGLLKNCSLVMDCWFESGCVPFAQHHYPFENKDLIDTKSETLCDFIAEGLDQTRGWFYTLHVLSTALFDKPAYKNVICTGLILDESGQKFSKKHGNFKDPLTILEKYSADVLRLYLLNSPVIHANPLYFTETNIEKLKQQIIPYINGVKFFINHCTNYLKQGNTLNITLELESKNLMDNWIISRTGTLLQNVELYMKSYTLDRSIQEIIDFIDDLTNWYIKFNRDRLKGLCGITEWHNSLVTFYKVVMSYTKIMAPFTPFLSEHIYQSIKGLSINPKESVFMNRYPDITELLIDISANTKMIRLQQVVRMIRSLRESSTNFTSIKVPVSSVVISHNNDQYIDDIKSVESLIQDEVNCLSFTYTKLIDSVTYKLVPNNKNMGTEFKGKATYIKNNLHTIDQKIISEFANNIIDHIIISEGATQYKLTKDFINVEVQPIMTKMSEHMKSKIDGETMVTIDTTYNDDIHTTYQLRLLMVFIQNMRKQTDLNPWDKICITFKTDKKINETNMKKIMDKLKCEIVRDMDIVPYVKNLFVWTNFDRSTENININIYKL